MADSGDETAVDDAPNQAPVWSDGVFRAGVAVGLFLLLLGLTCMAFLAVAQTISLLITCSGLGIIFGAFGSTAVIRYKGVVVAGVAAIAIALLYFVDLLMRDDLVRLRIDGDVREADLTLFGDETYPGAEGENRHEFVIIGREVKSEWLTLVVELSPEDAEKAGKPDVEFSCLPGRSIGQFLGSGKIIQWRFNASTEELTGVDGAENKTVRSGPCPIPGGLELVKDGELTIFSSALAQTSADVDALIDDLTSDSALVRRNAREELSMQGADAVALMMAALEEDFHIYRVRLGVSVALAEYLRENKDQRFMVSEMLTDEQLALITSAAGEDDRTVRVYASEFLYDLGDKRVVSIAEDLFPSASADGKYNLIVVLEGTVPNLTPAESQDLASALTEWRGTVGPNTQARIDTVLDHIQQ
ncbi:MAG: hypothetical protein AAF563_11085 [Pseudomonadota bacterium]